MKAIQIIRFQLSILLFIIHVFAYSQGKQANIWHFGHHAGLNFNTGSPPSLIQGGQTWEDNEAGVACISDSLGNLLFYTDGNKIWNKNHQQMVNGNDIGVWSTQGALIVPDPGNYNKYYVFNFNQNLSFNSFDFQYSVVDMSDGIGFVLSDEKCIKLYHNTSSHLSAVKCAIDNSIWVISHEYNSNCFLSFKVTSAGLSTIPVKSNAGNTITTARGYMKISPNGQNIAIAQSEYFFDILSLNSSNGQVSEDFFVSSPTQSYGLEFSPDNTKFYILDGFLDFYQYNLKAGNAQAILDSRIGLTFIFLQKSALQLGPDGKIYLCGSDNRYLGVINYPNKLGSTCNFIDNAIYLGDGRLCYEGLPSIIQSYLNDPEFATLQHCNGQPTQFTIASLNGVDSVEWKFNDPGNAPNDTSTFFSPFYTFSVADTFYVELTVHSGLIEKTVMDTVIIFQTPTPQFPNDTSYCADETIDLLLNAGPGQSYSWNNAWPTPNQTYQVTAPGEYTLSVIDNGCIGKDTIVVSRYVDPLVETSNVNPQNAGCNAADGSITGITVTGGDNVTYQWLNSLGVVVSNDLDLVNMPADFYTLHVKYGKRCSIQAYTGEIKNATAPSITGITPKHDHCNQSKGELTINANSSTGSPLFFSINGTDFFSSGVFTGLPADFYDITVKDGNNCINRDTITIKNIQGPTVTDSIATNENGYASDGTITITAQGTGLIYSLNNGSPQNNGVFTGLAAGSYEVKITDQWGCERFVYITVGRTNGTILSAYAGGDYKCKKELAHSSLTADNFINVKEYKAVLKYNTTRLTCIGHSSGHEFPDVVVAISPGRIEVQWHNDVPKTVTGTVHLVDLIFETTEWGSADIKWDTAYCEFKDDHGNIIQPALEPGVIVVNNPPQLQNLSSKTTYCEGERAELITSSSGGIGPFTYTWETPVTITTADTTILIDSIQVNQSGTYSLKILDSNNCADVLNIPVTVYALPSANFQAINDTIYYEQQTTLIATQGYASYQWNTGDTTYYTYVDKEGEYSVLIETTAGCQKMESVVMSDAYVDLKVPNAFTPNGDGLNDSFKPLVNLERIKHYHIAIYNKWGQLLFESNDPLKGWEANDLGNGVYTWVIDYENRVGKAGQMKGSVSLIK